MLTSSEGIRAGDDLGTRLGLKRRMGLSMLLGRDADVELK
jgi:hypothetical protein